MVAADASRLTTIDLLVAAEVTRSGHEAHLSLSSRPLLSLAKGRLGTICRGRPRILSPRRKYQKTVLFLMQRSSLKISSAGVVGYFSPKQILG